MKQLTLKPLKASFAVTTLLFAALSLLGLAGAAGAQTTPVYDSNTASDFAATRPAVSAGSVLVNGLTDVPGGIWSTASGTLTGTTSDGSGYTKNFLVRPVSENALNGGEMTTVPAQAAGNWAVGDVLRYQPGSKNCYIVAFGGATSGNELQCYKIVSGAATAISTGTTFSYNPAHIYALTATPSGSGTTTIAATLTDTTAGTTAATFTVTDTEPTLQSAGQTGVVVWNASVSISRIQTFTTANLATGYNAAPSASGGPVGTPLTLTFSPVPAGYTGSQTITATESGAAGSFGSGNTVTLGSGAQALTWTPSAAGTATFSFTNNGSLNDPMPIPYYCGLSLVEGYIGDSNDQYTPADGTMTAPQAVGVELSKLYFPRPVVIVNQGMAGSNSGQWIAGSTLLNNAEAAFAAAGVTIVHYKLGSNDANHSLPSLTPATYRANAANTCTDLVGKGYKVILDYPSYIVPGAVPFNNPNVITLAPDVSILQSYLPQIDSLVNGTTILQGDTQAFNYFKVHQSEFRDGLHFNAAGVASIASLEARADYNALHPVATLGRGRRLN